jgi:hypothetical protein
LTIVHVLLEHYCDSWRNPGAAQVAGFIYDRMLC